MCPILSVVFRNVVGMSVLQEDEAVDARHAPCEGWHDQHPTRRGKALPLLARKAAVHVPMV